MRTASTAAAAAAAAAPSIPMLPRQGTFRIEKLDHQWVVGDTGKENEGIIEFTPVTSIKGSKGGTTTPSTPAAGGSETRTRRRRRMMREKAAGDANNYPVKPPGKRFHNNAQSKGKNLFLYCLSFLK